MLTTLQQAKKLKELGYDRDCLYYYDGEQIEQSFFVDNECKVSVDDLLFDFNNDNWYGYPKHSISAPYISKALEWFREVKGIECEVCLRLCFMGDTGDATFGGYEYIIFDCNTHKTISSTIYHDRKVAESALLDEVMKYVESKL